MQHPNLSHPSPVSGRELLTETTGAHQGHWKDEDEYVDDDIRDAVGHQLAERIVTTGLEISDCAPICRKVRSAVKYCGKFKCYRPGGRDADQRPANCVKDPSTKYSAVKEQNGELRETKSERLDNFERPLALDPILLVSL